MATWAFKRTPCPASQPVVGLEPQREHSVSRTAPILSRANPMAPGPAWRSPWALPEILQAQRIVLVVPAGGRQGQDPAPSAPGPAPIQAFARPVGSGPSVRMNLGDAAALGGLRPVVSIQDQQNRFTQDLLQQPFRIRASEVGGDAAQRHRDPSRASKRSRHGPQRSGGSRCRGLCGDPRCSQKAKAQPWPFKARRCSASRAVANQQRQAPQRLIELITSNRVSRLSSLPQASSPAVRFSSPRIGSVDPHPHACCSTEIADGQPSHRGCRRFLPKARRYGRRRCGAACAVHALLPGSPRRQGPIALVSAPPLEAIGLSPAWPEPLADSPDRILALGTPAALLPSHGRWRRLKVCGR